MLKADYKNKDMNNIELLLGKPFMYNVEVKTSEKDGKTFVNTKLKSPVPLMKGMSVDAPLQASVSVNFEDDDLLEPQDQLGGISKFDLLRQTDLRKIVLAEDYPGSKMQAAVQEKFDEKELIAKAKEIYEKIVETDKDLIEIRAKYPNGKEGGVAAAPEEKPAVKPSKPEKPKAPVVEDDGDQAPF
jgi:hypothetical protein